jgi:hypothetical protein
VARFQEGDSVWVKNRKFKYDNPDYGTKGRVQAVDGHAIEVKLLTSGIVTVFDASNLSGTGMF